MMEQILLAYSLPKETVAAIMMQYKKTKVKVKNTEYFDIVASVPLGDTLAPYLFIICQPWVLRTSIDKIRYKCFKLGKERSRRYSVQAITDEVYSDDISLRANTLDQAETQLHSRERAAAGIGLHVNVDKRLQVLYSKWWHLHFKW